MPGEEKKCLKKWYGAKYGGKDGDLLSGIANDDIYKNR